MSCNNIGSSNRLMYDNCAYQKRMYNSTSPFMYMMYQGKHENKNKCIKDKFWTKQCGELTNIESELKGISRPMSLCDQFKYNPNCERSKLCISTFDKDIPVILDSDVCPVVYNNLPKYTTPMYQLPSINNFCGYSKPF